MIMSEIVEDYLDAEGVRYTKTESVEFWSNIATTYEVRISATRLVRIIASEHQPQLRIITVGERNRSESFVSVTAGDAALVQSIVRASINQL